MKRGVAATFKVGDRKCKIESDAIVNITTESGAVFKKLRVVGLNHMGDCLRGIGKDGTNEIPLKNITKVEEAKKGNYPTVEFY